MGLLSSFKLQKLTIYSFSDVERTAKKGKFEVMYNPTSISMSHQNVFEDLQGINTFGRQARYSYARSESLEVDLVIDGSGVSEFAFMSLLSGGAKTVTEQIDTFLELSFYMNGETHQPYFLRLEWGDGVIKNFDCRLDKVDIKYTSFARSGAPLRAELSVTFIADVDDEKQASGLSKASPDLSHVRVVRSGDTLPLLCQEIYGDPAHYIRVAQYNQLNHFRDLIPGQTLVFPPLAS